MSERAAVPVTWRRWALIGAPAFLAAFVFYGAARTMCESMGLDVRASVWGLIVASGLLTTAALIAVLIGLVFRARRTLVVPATALACGAAAACGILLEPWEASYAAAFVALPAILAAALHRADRRVLVRAAATLVAATLVGATLSESWILLDESRFADHVARDPGSARDRARAWPNASAALVYVPGQGIHATD